MPYLWFTMYVTWYDRDLHDHIKFLCALNKHYIYELYFSEAPRMKSVSNLECA